MESYGSRFIERVFDVPTATLHYWDKTGILKPAVRPAAGRGSRRLYSFRDLVQILVVSRLRDMGLSLQRVRKCLQFLRKNFPELEAPLAQLSFVSDGETVFVLTDDPDQLLDTLREQFVWSLPISTLVKSARAKIESETQEHKEIMRIEGQDFTVSIEQDPEDSWWVGLVEELPGCGSQGSTLDELRGMVADAIRDYLIVRGDISENGEEEEKTAAA